MTTVWRPDVGQQQLRQALGHRLISACGPPRTACLPGTRPSPRAVTARAPPRPGPRAARARARRRPGPHRTRAGAPVRSSTLSGSGPPSAWRSAAIRRRAPRAAHRRRRRRTSRPATCASAPSSPTVRASSSTSARSRSRVDSASSDSAPCPRGGSAGFVPSWLELTITSRLSLLWAPRAPSASPPCRSPFSP